MRNRMTRRLIQLSIVGLPFMMGASCDSNGSSTTGGVLAIIFGVVELVLTIISAF